MKFVSREEHYSIYLDSDGDEVHIAHGTMTRLVAFDFGIMTALWESMGRRRYTHRYSGAFIDKCYATFIDFDEEEIAWCAQCVQPHLREDCTEVQGDEYACSDCYYSCYTMCDDCEERSADTREVASGRDVCSSCRDDNYSYCDDCDDYYPYDDNHAHDGSGCCDPVRTDFTIRNDGDPLLANDTRAKVSLPAGTIDNEGIIRIKRHLQDSGLWDSARCVDDIGAVWQTKMGNFTKRLSRTAYNTYAQAIPPEVLSTIGCIAREHSTSVDFDIEVTRELNMSAADFYHEDSCWWQSYSASRCTLKSNGGFAIRTFGQYGDVTGRAFVMPLKNVLDHNGGHTLLPTFDTMNADAFMVFNGYGTLEGYAPTRLLSHMVGMTYRKINFSCHPMYVNSNENGNTSSYLVAPEAIAKQYTDSNLTLSVDQHSNLHYTEAKELTNA